MNNDFMHVFWNDLNSFILVNLELSNFYTLLDTFTNISVLSQALYTKYIYLFIISGMILLVAMLGAILLTLNHGFISKRQDLFLQINKKLIDSITLIT